MGTIIKDEGKVFHLAPAGMYQAVCFDFWDIGKHLVKIKATGKMKPVKKCYLALELDTRIESDDELNGKRYRLYRKYTMSLNIKADLAKDLASWFGRALTQEDRDGFDSDNLVGLNCFLNIIHKKEGDKTFANISAFNPLPKNIQPIPPENPRGTPEWIIKLRSSALAEVPAEIIEVGGDEEPTAE